MFMELNYPDTKPFVGNCDVCGCQKTNVKPLIWNFPFIECRCHDVSLGHIQRKNVCAECEPTAIPPIHDTVHFDTYILSAITELIHNHEAEYNELKEHHYRLMNKTKEEQK